MKTEKLTQDEAHRVMQLGHKVTREYFSPDEYVFIEPHTGIITSEEGHDFTEWWDNIEIDIPSTTPECWSVWVAPKETS